MSRTRAALLTALIASLALPFPIADLGGLRLTITEPLAILAALLALTRRPFRWPPIWLVAAFALVTLAAVVNGASVPLRVMLLAYGFGLAWVTATLAQGDEAGRWARTWLLSGVVPAAVGTAAVLLYFAGLPLHFALHPFGTLPPGPYPRVQSTFAFPAMLANYLGVTVLLMLALRQRAKVGATTFAFLSIVIGICLAFTFTPGLGTIVAAVCAWQGLAATRSRWWLAGAGLALIASVVLAALTPIAHPSAAWSLNLFGRELYPSVRWLTWSDAWQRFLAHPLVGQGLTGGPVSVDYRDPTGIWHHLTDAHNVFLNVAAQTGVLGLAGYLLIVGWVGQTMREHRDSAPSWTTTLGLAWLGGFAAAGLTGSYEDARHLWVLLGLIIASRSADQASSGRTPLNP